MNLVRETYKYKITVRKSSKFQFQSIFFNSFIWIRPAIIIRIIPFDLWWLKRIKKYVYGKIDGGNFPRKAEILFFSGSPRGTSRMRRESITELPFDWRTQRRKRETFRPRGRVLFFFFNDTRCIREARRFQNINIYIYSLLQTLRVSLKSHNKGHRYYCIRSMQCWAK